MTAGFLIEFEPAIAEESTELDPAEEAVPEVSDAAVRFPAEPETADEL